MFKSYFVILSLIAATASGAPTLQKRIAQVISESTAKWEQACLAAGGGQRCNPLSIAAFTTLLAAAADCDQQDKADEMVNLGKELKSQDVVNLSLIFAQQPRNTPSSQSVPYCQKAPANPELNDVFHCQFAGADPKTFVGGIAVGGAGTIPFGHNAPLNPPGSCRAHPDGPIPDGQQLVSITQNPGTSGTGSQGSSAVVKPPSTAVSNAAAAPPATPGGDFHHQNGLDAQALNQKFSTLTATSPCTAGENACVDGKFAQCVAGQFALTPCAGGLKCVALPLVNKPGTSVTCSTDADAAARIATAEST